jgi:hypothetical protein
MLNGPSQMQYSYMTIEIFSDCHIYSNWRICCIFRSLYSENISNNFILKTAVGTVLLVLVQLHNHFEVSVNTLR